MAKVHTLQQLLESNHASKVFCIKDRLKKIIGVIVVIGRFCCVVVEEDADHCAELIVGALVLVQNMKFNIVVPAVDSMFTWCV